ncbi:uncharacterized protein MYCGRDRAFT_37094 [Zymoseptoria tritici IPO323]|uniref:Uncharacterized protein n=1 Tax=Zymoseptoria tritici (strain CBS 115943 / IPO323) TaxID=336722 RepID=F9X3F0_ZYMTI|nr:uncharacterized protein MYCGRDRAFT_37094 [Zymoseptoria tritici IPO323]EGP89740.1 hypothetical protein MYCGRDRAFT_37094 [Zymoseptoria tritici IPO323]
MRFSIASLALAALATQTVVADGWFGKSAYNKWHETELERWLSDHNVPYPKAADRKALEDLVKGNWDNNVVKPYSNWDVNQLTSFLSSKGQEVKKGSENTKESLLSQVQSLWTETADSANDAYGNVHDWIFDSWTESQLKAFLDYHHIPNPSPRTRDSLLSTARSNYQSIATKVGETAAYPGDWLYQSWSDSDLKAWLDERGVPVPQPSARDKMIASIRRNAKIGSDSVRAQYSTAAASAQSAQASLSDALFDSWSDSQLKEWADKNGVKVPQGSKRNEIIALARKHSAKIAGGASASATSAYGAATTSAGNFYAQGTNAVYGQFRGIYDKIANQIGLASAEAKASLSSASSIASVTASSASSVASVSASSASSSLSVKGSKSSSVASKSATSAASVASSSTQSAKKEAAKSAESSASKASASAKSAKNEL